MVTKIKGITKRVRPIFTRYESNKKLRLDGRWRKPRGRHNAVRLHLKGYQSARSTGYGSDKRIRYMIGPGLLPIRIHTEKELLTIKKETEGALISKNVGQKNKLALVKKAKENGITVLNVRDADEYIKTTEERFNQRKQTKTVSEKQKEEKMKAADKKETKKEEKTHEEKQKEEKKIKEEVLTKG